MDTENFKLDIGHIWIPLKKAQKMLALENEVTYVSYAIGEKKVEKSGSGSRFFYFFLSYGIGYVSDFVF